MRFYIAIGYASILVGSSNISPEFERNVIVCLNIGLKVYLSLIVREL